MLAIYGAAKVRVYGDRGEAILANKEHWPFFDGDGFDVCEVILHCLVRLRQLGGLLQWRDAGGGEANGFRGSPISSGRGTMFMLFFSLLRNGGRPCYPLVDLLLCC